MRASKSLSTNYLPRRQAGYLLSTKKRRRLFSAMLLPLLLIVGGIIALRYVLPARSSAAWFDGSYSNRKLIPVANSSGSEQTDFTIDLSLDTATLISASKMQSDCDDLRFTDVNGKLLPYWLEPNTCNSASTKVFVKIPSIPTSGADIYWYYGNPSASSASQADQAFLRAIDPAVANWPLDDTDTNQSYGRVINTGASAGRELLLNGGFTDGSNWNLGTGWTISGGTLNASNPSASTSQSSMPFVVGRAYTVTFTVSNYVSGSVKPLVCNAGSGTFRSANGTYTETIICSGSTSFYLQHTSDLVASIDNVSVKEVQIPATSATTTNLLTDGNMETAGVASWTAFNATLSKQTATPHGGSQVLRVTTTASNAYALQNFGGTAGTVYRVTGYMRGDGTDAPRIAQAGNIVVSGTSSTSWQPFDAVYVAGNSLGIYLVDSTATTGHYVEFDDVVVSTDTSIRSGELLQDGTMEASGTGVWVAGIAGTVSKQTVTVHGGGSGQVLRVVHNGTNNNPYVYQDVLKIGSTYRLTGWARGDGGTGRMTVSMIGGATVVSGATSTTWTYYDTTFVATTARLAFQNVTSTAAAYAEIDDFSLTEVSPIVGTFSSTASLKPTTNTAASGHLSKAYSFDGSNDNVNVYSSSLNSAFNPNEGTLVAWAKVSGSGVWTDGGLRYIAQIAVDDNNRVVLYKSSASNIISGFSRFGGSIKEVQISTSTTGWFQIALSWSKSSDQVKVYFNGSQQGSTQTSLGTLSGNLSATTALIGSYNTSGSPYPWSGLINDVRLYNRALTATEIASMYSASSDIQTYSTNNFPGKELIRKYNASVTTGTLAAEETTPGPVAEWKMDDGQGQTVQDSSKNNLDGTLGATSGSSTDDPTWTTEDQCVSGKCLSFDGTNDYVNGGTPTSLDLQASFSVGAWIKPSSIKLARVLANGDSSSSPYTEYVLGITAAGKGRFEVQTSNSTTTLLTTETLQANSWYYLSGTWDGSTMKIYLNGSLSNSVSKSGTINEVNNTIYIGGSTQFSEFFNGFIDEAKVYPYARSAAQVKADFDSGAAALSARNPSFALSNGLVGYWKMDESSWNGTSGEVLDASGNGNHGTSAGGATTAAGKFGNGGSFDAVNDYVDVAGSSTFALSNFTASAWFKQSGTIDPSYAYGVVLSKGDRNGNGNKDNYHISVSRTTGALTARVGNGSTLSSVISSNSVADGLWHFVTLTSAYNGTTTSLNLFIDGVLIGQSILSGSPYTTASGNAQIGAWQINTSSYYGLFPGYIDEVRIYNRTLSPVEVRQLYQYAPGPVGHWKFDEGTGTSVTDSSGNGNTGTLTNGPTWGNGAFGRALSFDGNNQYVSVPYSTLFDFDTPSSYAVEAWAYIKNDGATHEIIHGPYTSAYPFRMYTNVSNSLITAVYNGTTVNAITTDYSNYFNKWTHITFTKTPTSICQYINGILVSSCTAFSLTGSTKANSGNLNIGKHNSAANYMNGLIDDVRIYNYARTPEQILQDMGGSEPGSTLGSKLPKPLAYYKFDEQQGQTINNSGLGGSSLNGTQGVNSSVGSDEPIWKARENCKIGGCLSFDGSNDLVNIADNALLYPGTGHFSTSLWMNTSSSGTRRALLTKYNAGAAEEGFAIMVETDGKVKIRTGDFVASRGEFTTTTAVVNDGTWKHLLVVFDRTQAQPLLYINGIRATLTTNVGSLANQTGTIDNVNPLQVGYCGTNNAYCGTYFSGFIDEVKIYNTALTEDQVREDYNAGAAFNFGSSATSEVAALSDGAGNPPLLSWDFDENTGSSVTDKSGNGYTGTFAGALSPIWRPGKNGSGLFFTANTSTTGSRATYTGAVPILGTTTGNQATLSMWLKPNATQTNTVGMFLRNGQAYDENVGLEIGSLSGGNYKVTTSYYDGTTWRNLSTTNRIIPTNTWSYLSVVLTQGTNVKVYVNGTLQETLAWSGNNAVASSSTFNIGTNPAAAQQSYDGYIDDVKIYNYARTPAQIAYDYNRGKPIAQWRMDECQGTVIHDSSGNNFSGTLTVGATGTQTSAGTCATSATAWGNGASGKYSASLNFDGTNDYVVNTNESNFDFSSDFTISTWVKPDSSMSSGYVGLIGKYQSDQSGWDLILFNGAIRMALRGTSNIDTQTYGPILAMNSWQHVAVVNSNSFIKIYLDGQLRYTSSGTWAPTLNNASVYIGNRDISGGTPYYKGQIDDVQIYNYALSAAQVKQLYNNNSSVNFAQ